MLQKRMIYYMYWVMSRAPVVLWLGYHLASHLGHICLPAAQQSFGKVVEWASGCSASCPNRCAVVTHALLVIVLTILILQFSGWAISASEVNTVLTSISYPDNPIINSAHCMLEVFVKTAFAAWKHYTGALTHCVDPKRMLFWYSSTLITAQ